MKIIVNLLPLKTGGGVQVALDFLAQANLYGKEHTWLVVARKDGPFSDYPETSNIKVVALVEDNIRSRLYFEYFGCKTLINKYQPDLIYTQFGPHWPGSRVTNVAGCAYSNIFYPDLDFWGSLPPLKRLVKKCIDRLRLKRILAADVRIFETKDLADRAINQYGLSKSSVFYVRAAVSSLVTESSFHVETQLRCESLPRGYKILLLSGYHPNKNIEFLVDTAADLKRRGIKDVSFILTLPESDPGTQTVIEKINSLGVTDYIYNFGPVPQAGCCELYRYCNAAILPSTLESFSNMIAESWAMKKLLYISDLSWGRSLCGSGAVYYDFLNSESLINQIVRYKEDNVLAEEVIEAGSKELSGYPSSKERFLSYLSIIESVDSGGEK